jgi:putative sigma-54 modulation protein
MNTNVTFRHMDSSDSLRDYAVGKLERVVDKYVHGSIDASVTLSVEKFRHIASYTVQIKNLTVKGDSSSEDMYSSIDLALDKIERQLRRHKDRLRDHKPSHGANGHSKSFRMSIIAPSPVEPEEAYADEFATDYEQFPAPTPEEQAAEAAPTSVADDATEVGTFATAHGPVTVKRQRDYAAKALSVEEAVIQLDLMEDREFFVFTNEASSSLNIIYRRKDGSFGLIET